MEQDKNDDNDDDGQIGQRNLRNQESPALKPRQKVRQDQSIIMDILGMAPTVKQSSSTAEQSITKKKKLTHKPAAEGETIAQTQKRDDGDDVVKDNTAAVVGSPQMDMMDIEEPDSTRKRKRSHIEQTETFSIGQKLAACIKAEDGEERYLVVIVQTELDDATGMYTVRDPEARKGEQETWLLPPEKLIRFDYTEKQFSVGERVQSLFRGASNRRGGGVSSVFYPATVSRMAGNVVHVKFDDGDVAVMKLDELFSVEK